MRIEITDDEFIISVEVPCARCHEPFNRVVVRDIRDPRLVLFLRDIHCTNCQRTLPSMKKDQ